MLPTLRINKFFFKMASCFCNVWQTIQKLIFCMANTTYIIGRHTPWIGRQTPHNRDGKRSGFWCAFTDWHTLYTLTFFSFSYMANFGEGIKAKTLSLLFYRVFYSLSPDNLKYLLRKITSLKCAVEVQNRESFSIWKNLTTQCWLNKNLYWIEKTLNCYSL